MADEKKVNFQLLLKSEENSDDTKLISFEGFIKLVNLKDESFMIIKFKFYEIFYSNLVFMLEYLVGKKPLSNHTIEITSDKDVSLLWLPHFENNIKSIKLCEKHKDSDSYRFEITFEIKSFFSFLLGFGLCILPSLLLSENEKILFHFSFNPIFNDVYKEPIFNEVLAYKTLKTIKNTLEIDVDLANALNLLKYYFSLFILLYKANDLVTIKFP